MSEITIRSNDLSWLAGYLEGEGTFYLHINGRSSLHPTINVKSTDLDIIEKVHNMMGLNNKISVIKPENPQWKIIYQITTTKTKPAILWMEVLYPFMGIRRQIAIEDTLANSTYTGQSVLNYSVAQEIRGLYKTTDLSQRKIAAMFDVSSASVSQILLGKIWKEKDHEGVVESRIIIQQSELQDEQELTIHWLAGLLEGEGSFFLTVKKKPLISYNMTDLDVVEKGHHILGSRRSIYKMFPQNANRKIGFLSCTGGELALTWMKRLYPLMGTRRQEQITKVLNNHTYRGFIEDG